MNKEIEIHKKTNDLASLLDFLTQNAQKTTTNEYQNDLYFTPSHRDFLAAKPIAEWLRVRKTTTKSIITYKNWKYVKNESTNVALELESEISNIDNIMQIFRALDFKEIVRVEKNRNSYIYKGVEISIDEVVSLGTYIDLENKTIQGSDEYIVNYLEQMAQELKLLPAPEMKLGYPILILEKNC